MKSAASPKTLFNIVRDIPQCWIIGLLLDFGRRIGRVGVFEHTEARSRSSLILLKIWSPSR